ncbi:MAG: OmpA family protein [Segatella copri]
MNSYKIAPAEDAKIREVVDFLNKNTEAKVVVTGYADKGTGYDVINDRIAAKRATAVVWMLTKKYNIPSERITEESKGARVQPFAENAENRVTIMIAK